MDAQQQNIVVLMLTYVPVLFALVLMMWGMLTIAWRSFDRPQKKSCWIRLAISVVATSVAMAVFKASPLGAFGAASIISVAVWLPVYEWAYTAWRNAGVNKWIRRGYILGSPLIAIVLYFKMKYFAQAVRA